MTLGLMGQAIVKGTLALMDLKNAFIEVRGAILRLIPIMRAFTAELFASVISLNTYKRAINILTNVVLSLGSAFIALISALRFAFSPVGLVLLGLSVVLYALYLNFERIKKAIAELWDSFKTFFFLERLEPLWEGFKIGLIWAKEGIEVLKEAFKPLFDAFSNLISAIFGVNVAVKGFNEGTFKGWLETGVSLGRAFAETFNLIAKGVAVFLKPLITGLSFFINLIATAIEYYKRFSDNPFVKIGITLATLLIPFFAIFRALKLIRLGIVGVRFAVIGITYAVGFVVESFKWLWGVVQGVWNWFVSAFLRLGESFALSFLKVKEALSTAISFITSLLLQAFTLWWRFSPFRIIYEGWQRAVSFLKSINLFEIGKNILEGFVAGLRSVASVPVQIVKEVGSKIVNTFKGLMKIKSPSVLFMEFGINTLEGFVAGLRSVASVPVEAIAGIGSKVVNAFKSLTEFPNLNFEGGIGVGSLLGKDYRTQAPTTTGKTIIINKVIDRLEVIIHGEVKGTPKEIAKEIGEGLEAKLADLLMRLV